MGKSHMSRKSFLAMVGLGLTSVIVPGKADATEWDDVPTISPDFPLPEGGWASPEQYVAWENEYGLGWTTSVLGEDGQIREVAHFDTFSFDFPQTRGAITFGSIAVKVGVSFLCTVAVKFLDGIIIEVTGGESTGLYDYIARKLLGKRAPAGNTITLPCSVYPPNSGEYVRCMHA